MEFYDQFVINDDSGVSSAVVTVLLVLIAPLMWLQIRTVRRQEELR
jgi:ABC-type sugar transport system permease subunit